MEIIIQAGEGLQISRRYINQAYETGQSVPAARRYISQSCEIGESIQNGRRYINQNYETVGGSHLNAGHGQHGSFIPVIPARPVNDVPTCLPPRHLNKKTNALYKTEMCRNWNEIGECRYGRSCQFAHGKKELRTVPRHGQWKTKTCMAWLHGGCTYGSRCCYARELLLGSKTSRLISACSR